MLSTIAMIVSFTVWSVFAPIATEIQKMYQLSDLEKSILIATPVLLGSMMRIPMGILTDRYGGRKIYALTMFLLVIPMVGAGFADSYPGSYSGRSLLEWQEQRLLFPLLMYLDGFRQKSKV